LPGHLRALNAILRCRTPDSGELYVQCPDCGHAEWRPRSCGHRSCPKCQNHEASRWIDRQQAKLLPVLYFMVTFTLPYELRSLVWHHQKDVYSILFGILFKFRGRQYLIKPIEPTHKFKTIIKNDIFEVLIRGDRGFLASRALKTGSFCP
jgi:hypothetical protein